MQKNAIDFIATKRTADNRNAFGSPQMISNRGCCVQYEIFSSEIIRTYCDAFLEFLFYLMHSFFIKSFKQTKWKEAKVMKLIQPNRMISQVRRFVEWILWQSFAKSLWSVKMRWSILCSSIIINTTHNVHPSPLSHASYRTKSKEKRICRKINEMLRSKSIGAVTKIEHIPSFDIRECFRTLGKDKSH